jgi:hypothetical protein
LAKHARDRLHGKGLPGISPIPFAFDAILGEGLFGNMRRFDDENSPWKEAKSPKGEVYYYHVVTRQTSWVKPMPELMPPVPPPAMPMVPGKARPPGHGLLGLTPPPPAAPPAPGSAAHSAQAVVNQAQATINAAQLQSMGAKMGPVGGNLFVYHIPTSWDDSILRQHFEHFGTIISCRIQKDLEGRARGFGFVSFDSSESAQSAIAGMHGFPVEGKWLKVQLKKGDEQLLTPGAADPGIVPPPPPGLPSMRPAMVPPPPRPGPY